MTYTVKNGTWCKDNEKEYYSTTKTGLKAALKAGEISAGTRVVIHDPKYHAGQLIQSLNPECPEGCFVPDGSTIDPVYEELIAVVGPNLPDMRECVLVMAGQNEHITTHAHDVFSAGEFKDDCAVEHSHTITITDPGHRHTVNDPGHKHTIDISDPGHEHSVTDPGHDHGRGTFEITGSYDGVQQDYQAGGTGTGAFSDSVAHGGGTDLGSGGDRCVTLNFKASNDWTGRSEKVTTGVSVDSNTTGITASANNSATGVSVDSNTTGITASCSTTGDNVTRTKQFGVYYYIAF